jgi:phage baseplate assembly protein W
MATAVRPDKAFLGVGWSFPLAASAGQARVAQYEEDVRQAIRIILLTNPGERIMRPTFGAGLNRFAFEPLSSTTLHAIRTRVEEALIDWESRIDIITISVTPDRSRAATVLIDIHYRVRLTNSVGNLVYPFYLGEGPGR